MMAAAQRLEPIYNELRELVKDSYYAVSYTHLFVFEMRSYECYTSGVTYQNYFVCQPFGLYVKMEDVYKRQAFSSSREYAPRR